MKKWTYIFCLAILVASCSGLLTSKPSGTLSESKMVDMLVDMHITEATVKFGVDSIEHAIDTTESRNRFAEVFRNHNVKPEEFNQSMNYYLEHVEELDKIYSEVISRLTEIDAKLVPVNKQTVASINGSNKIFSSPWFPASQAVDLKGKNQYFDHDIYLVSPSK
jgi:hypothetical protein